MLLLGTAVEDDTQSLHGRQPIGQSNRPLPATTALLLLQQNSRMCLGWVRAAEYCTVDWAAALAQRMMSLIVFHVSSTL